MREMNKRKIIILSFLLSLVFANCSSIGSKIHYHKSDYRISNIKKILYLQPDVFPIIEEIKQPTSHAFSSTVAEYSSLYNGIKIIPIEHSMNYENTDNEYIKELSHNNNADAIIIPKVKYFKVGLGKYVFSNQVLVSLKLFSSNGNLLLETEYDTYKGNARLIGKAENSIKIGTRKALKQLLKNLRK